MKSICLDDKKFYPSKIVCIGRNYVDHIKELDNEIPKEPVIFIKPNSAISKEVHASGKESIHYEGEITFLVESGEFKGIGFGIDLTKREIQHQLKKKGLPWERAKSFDKSAVFSEFVSFKGEFNQLRLEFYKNDALVQHGGCDLMLNKPDFLLNESKKFLSFEDGDLLMTGTPKGVGELRPGDKLVGKIFKKAQILVMGSWTVI